MDCDDKTVTYAFCDINLFIKIAENHYLLIFILMFVSLPIM